MYYKLIENYLSENKTKLVFCLVIILIIYPGEAVVLPQLYSKFFDGLKTNQLKGQFNNIYKAFFTKNAAGSLIQICLLWFLFIILFHIKNNLTSYLIPKLLSDIRNVMFKGFVKKTSEDFKEAKQGELISRILEVSRAIKDIFNAIQNHIIPITFTSIISIIVITLIEFKIGIIIIIGCIIHIFFDIALIPRIFTRSVEREAVFLNTVQEYTNSFSNLMNVFLNNQEDSTIQKNKDNEDEHSKLFSETWLLADTASLIGTIITIITFIIVLLKFFDMRAKKEISVVNITSITIILLYFIGNIRKLQDEIPYIATKFGVVENSREFIESIINIDDDANREDQETEYDSIKISNLTFNYKDKVILDNLNLEVKPEEKIALIGPSGTGKTTLMKLLLKLHKVDSSNGTIMIGDTNINDLSRSQVRNHITYINQKTTLFDTTIMENLMFGNNKTEAEVKQLLKSYDLQIIFDKVGGIYANAGVSGSNLSLGMQKIVIIIRGILRDAKILLIDEPLAGLDAKTRVKVLNLIRHECKDKTMIIVTHDKEVYEVVDRVLDMKQIQAL